MTNAVKKIVLSLTIGFLIVASVFFLRYETGRAGDLSQPSEAAVPPATSEMTPASPQVLKGSGKFISIEPKQTGDFLLSVQDELETEKAYLVPKGLTFRRGEEEIRPSRLQTGDVLDIDYAMSETGERVVSYLSVTIPAQEKEIRVDAPILDAKPKETP